MCQIHSADQTWPHDLGLIVESISGYSDCFKKGVDHVDHDLGNYVASRSAPQSLPYLDLNLDLNNKVLRYKISLIFPGLDLDLDFDLNLNSIGCLWIRMPEIDHDLMIINLLGGGGGEGLITWSHPYI